MVIRPSMVSILDCTTASHMPIALASSRESTIVFRALKITPIARTRPLICRPGESQSAELYRPLLNQGCDLQAPPDRISSARAMGPSLCAMISQRQGLGVEVLSSKHIHFREPSHNPR